ncbi:MAG TPA: hypothetical protein VHF25_00635 [Nitriliruptorales bacterium]|nr:hypothetical protein [Nitriliruptorales bacterium]
MASELDLSHLIVVDEAAYRHPAGTGAGTWTCPVCATATPLTRASLVRVRDRGLTEGTEYALLLCATCRQQLGRSRRIRHRAIGLQRRRRPRGHGRVGVG